MTRIKIKNSQVKDKAPQPGDLINGEIAINTHVDSPSLYVKDTSGNIVKLAGAGAIGGTPATETEAGIAELATQAETDAGTDDQRIVTPLKLKNAVDGFVPQATEAVAGKAELATQDETDAGTDDQRIVTPAKLQAKITTEINDALDGTGGTGGLGYWDRTGTVVSPTNTGDTIATDDNAVQLIPGTIGSPLTRESSGHLTIGPTGTPAISLRANGSFHTNGSTSPGVDKTALLWAQGQGLLSIQATSTLTAENTGIRLYSGAVTRETVNIGTNGAARLEGALTIGNGTTNAVSLDPGATGSPLVRDSAGNLKLGPSGSEVFEIYSDGNMRIGDLTATSTTTRGAKLGLSPATGQVIVQQTAAASGTNKLVRVLAGTNEKFAVFGDGKITNPAISLSPASPATPLVRDAAGRIGVGTNDPQHRLSFVQGQAFGWVSAAGNAKQKIEATINDGLGFYTGNQVEQLQIKSNGTLNLSSVAIFADNTAAVAGGLVAGDVYRTAAGQLMITF